MGECQYDDECPDNNACIEHQCLDPCNSQPCGRNAICETKGHIPICRCPPNTAGNPHEECFTCKLFAIFFPICRSHIKQPFQFLDECLVDNDCPLNKKCKNKNCVDPCRDIICGSNAECKAEFHKGVCYCPRGLQGNPLVACTEVGCRSNDDCRSSEACDFLGGSQTKKECQPLCTRNPCAKGASCTASNHRETCKCDYPLQGDGYSSCYESKIKLLCLHKYFCS